MASYYRIGAAGLNWNNVGSWSATSGGASNGSGQPTGSDDVIFDANSPVSVTVTTPAVCASISLGKTSLILTLNDTLTVSGTMTLSVTMSFAGTSGWTCAMLTVAAITATTLTLKNSVTYTITGTLNCYSAPISTILFTSDDAVLKANLTLVQGVTCRCIANFTRINSSGGRPIRSFNGVITSCLNISAFNDLITIGIAK